MKRLTDKCESILIIRRVSSLKTRKWFEVKLPNLVYIFIGFTGSY